MLDIRLTDNRGHSADPKPLGNRLQAPVRAIVTQGDDISECESHGPKYSLMLKLSKLFVSHLVEVVDDFKVMFSNQIDDIHRIDKEEDHHQTTVNNVPSAADKPKRRTIIKLDQM